MLLGLLVSGVLMTAVAVAAPLGLAKVVCGLGALISVAMFLIGLPTLFHRGNVPLLTVTDQGLENPRFGLVPWHEIEEVGQARVAGRPALAIWTKDPYYAARNGPWYLWPFALFNRALHQPPMSFTDNAVPVDELLAEIEQRWRASGAGLAKFESSEATVTSER